MNKDKYRFHRVIDKWIGSLLLFLFGLVHRKRQPPEAPKSFALMKTDGLGDLVLLTAVVRDIRVAVPDARIILVCGPFNYPLASLLDGIDHIISLNLSNPIPAMQELRRQKVDVCLDLGEWSRIEAIITYFSRARWTTGFNTPGQYRHFAYDKAMPHRRDQHETANFQSLLHSLDMSTGLLPEIRCPADENNMLSELKHPYVVFQLWCGSAKYAYLKEWPEASWLQLTEWFNQKGFTVYLTGARSEAARSAAFISKCTWDSHRVIALCGRTFPDLFVALKNAALVISIDTSITHLTGALGGHILSLHGPSSSKRWGPLGIHACSIDTSCPGCGYMNWGADSTPEKAKLPCMQSITVEEVISAVERIVDAG